MNTRISLRNLKSCNGTDGVAYSCTILFDGRVVAEAAQGGHGAPTEFYFKDRSDESAVNAYVASLPVTPVPASEPKWMHEAYPDGQKEDLDSLVAGLFDDMENTKKLRRACKTKTLFRIKGSPEGVYNVVKAAFSPVVKAALLARHPDIEFFYNETLA
jgi:hypothetical protein